MLIGVLGLSLLSELSARTEPGFSAGAAATATIRASSRPGRTGVASTAPSPPRSTASGGKIQTAEPIETGAFAPTGSIQQGIVTRVIDGDTVVVEIDGLEVRIRYIGMDTPESNESDPGLRALADAATEANEALVGGRRVILERDVSETDRFDRLLRNVWGDDGAGRLVMVGLELVRLGFAQVATFPPDVKYVDLLIGTQAEARTAGVGLWAAEPGPTPTPLGLLDHGSDTVTVGIDQPARFSGSIGQSSWSRLRFEGDRATVRWDVTAANETDCQVAWRLEPESGPVIRSTVRVEDPHGFDREGDGIACEGA